MTEPNLPTPHHVTKIISGGQTGADQGGLRAGFELGIETGGTAPPQFRTDEGLNPCVLKAYGLVEGEPDYKTYPKRTHKNVADSDGTVLFGRMSSPGCALTIKYCIELSRPLIVNPDPSALRHWVTVKDIHTLNVAGNRERTNPGIHEKTLFIVTAALA